MQMILDLNDNETRLFVGQVKHMLKEAEVGSVDTILLIAVVEALRARHARNLLAHDEFAVMVIGKAELLRECSIENCRTEHVFMRSRESFHYKDLFPLQNQWKEDPTYA
ncbi:MAG: hypothetical protein GY807_23475 [Gammaproteobacteria bacterium]|nr:hypothetical protein [Gammaproteobacteria bacterium]